MKRTLLMVALAAALGGAVGLVACGSSTTGTTPTGGDVTAATGSSFVAYAVKSLKLPLTRDQYSIDLDGDGKVDNALANIVNVLASQGLDTQGGVDTSISSGNVVVLLEAQTSDPTMQSANGVGVTYYIGKSFKQTCEPGDGGACTGGPDFSGMGMFTVDQGIPSSVFLGNVTGGKFSSNNPATTKIPVLNVQLKLAIVGGGAPAVTLPTSGAHLSFTVSNGGIMDGMLQGAVKTADLQGSVLPAIAGFLTSRLMAAPNDPGNKSISMLFDVGGCSDGGVAAKAGDNTVTPCELANADLIKNLLGADVQLFDAQGNYAPNKDKANAKKDSLSVAVGFQAVPAKLTK